MSIACVMPAHATTQYKKPKNSKITEYLFRSSLEKTHREYQQGVFLSVKGVSELKTGFVKVDTDNHPV